MKGHEFVRFRSVLDSLAASTTVEIIQGGIETRVSGRCSPYLSHREVEFSAVEPIHSGMVIRNNWAVLIIRPSDEEENRFAPAGEFEMEPVRAKVPFAWLRGVLGSIQEYVPEPSGLFCEDGQMMSILFYIEVLDRFEEDEDGKFRPVYKPAPAPALDWASRLISALEAEGACARSIMLVREHAATVEVSASASELAAALPPDVVEWLRGIVVPAGAVGLVPPVVMEVING